jgi:hypothetical protein
LKIQNWIPYVQDGGKWKVFVEKAKTFLLKEVKCLEGEEF